jgi:hypothetical protein
VPVGGQEYSSKATGQCHSTTIRKRDPAMLGFELANYSPEIRRHIITLVHPKQQDILNSAFC